MNGGLLAKEKNLSAKYPGFFRFTTKEDGTEKLLASKIWLQFKQKPEEEKSENIMEQFYV